MGNLILRGIGIVIMVLMLVNLYRVAMTGSI